MDRSVQLRHLAEAERHIASGVEHISNQEQRIADLDFRGRVAVSGGLAGLAIGLA